ncbi:MAG TPA: PadR family transcriptional regulator [Fimbriimonadaceae bacterium]
MGYKHEIEAMVLGVLREGPLHGYKISQSIRAQAQGLLKLGDNQIYPVLHKLEESGLVQAEWQPQEGKPPRKVYSLTEKGSERLETHQKDWQRYTNSISMLIGARAATDV